MTSLARFLISSYQTPDRCLGIRHKIRGIQLQNVYIQLYIIKISAGGGGDRSSKDKGGIYKTKKGQRDKQDVP